MKNIRHIKAVNIPWYLTCISIYEYKTGEITIGVFPTVKKYAIHLWYLFPKWLQEYQAQDCINYIPDYVNPIGAGRREATGIKVRTFFGYVIRTEQEAVTGWKWWKLIEKY